MALLNAPTPPPQSSRYEGLLGRLASVPDPRNRAYRMAAALPEDWQTRPLPQRKHWPMTMPIRDQGSTSSCVGHGAVAFLESTPLPQRGFPFTPYQLYRDIQKVDSWPGDEDEAPRYFGTSVHAALRVLRDRGYCTEYRWAETLEEALRWLAFRSPLIIGVDWHQGMFTADAQGFIHATGTVRGGHCVLVSGMDTRRSAVRLTNSWGVSWGQNGRAWLSFEDFEKLIHARGEVAAATETKAPRP